MALTRLEIVRREPFEDGRPFAETGPYERIDAVAHYAVDPAHPANAGIVDLDRAERDADGTVRFSGDATFLVPVDASRANRALLLDVPNRGNRIAMRSFNMAAFDLMPTDEITPGDGFLLERGWCIAWCGWQWDVPHPSVRLGLRAPAVPRAKRTPAGRMQLRIQPDRATDTFALTDQHVGPVGNHAPIPPHDPDDPEAALWVREHLFDAPERIPRDRWAFVGRNGAGSDGRSGSRSDGRNDDRSDGRSDDRSGSQSDDWSGDRSDDRSGDRSDDRSGDRSGDRSDDRSGDRSDDRSSDRSGSRCGDRNGDRSRDDGGSATPDATHVRLDGGFRPGRIYDLVYTPAECPVVGAGLLAVRDLAAWARGSGDAPTAGRVDHAIAQGVSQCGRFLRAFLHAGLNIDEAGRQVFDGVFAHVAGGRRGEFNHRYGQPSVQPTPSLGHRFPFADAPQTDPRSGRRAGLLDRQRAHGHVPKIFYTDTSSEYWRGDAGLAHRDLASGADAEPPAEVRRYLFASTQHGPGVLPFARRSMFGSHCANRLNVVDYRPLFRAALENLRAWIAHGVEPPASVFPRARDGTAASREDVLDALARIPELVLPRTDRLPSLAPMDLGEHAGEGVPDLPARFTGGPYPARVSAVDAFGNETGGLRMPDVAVPVATHTGFNPRHAETGGDGQILEYLGSTAPLARTAAEREAVSDPRPSVAERYASRDAYLAEVRAEAQRLVEARYLLAGDVALCVALAGERYDAVTR